MDALSNWRAVAIVVPMSMACYAYAEMGEQSGKEVQMQCPPISINAVYPHAWAGVHGDFMHEFGLKDGDMRLAEYRMAFSEHDGHIVIEAGRDAEYESSGTVRYRIRKTDRKLVEKVYDEKATLPPRKVSSSESRVVQYVEVPFDMPATYLHAWTSIRKDYFLEHAIKEDGMHSGHHWVSFSEKDGRIIIAGVGGPEGFMPSELVRYSIRKADYEFLGKIRRKITGKVDLPEYKVRANAVYLYAWSHVHEDFLREFGLEEGDARLEEYAAIFSKQSESIVIEAGRDSQFGPSKAIRYRIRKADYELIEKGSSKKPISAFNKVPGSEPFEFEVPFGAQAIYLHAWTTVDDDFREYMHGRSFGHNRAYGRRLQIEDYALSIYEQDNNVVVRGGLSFPIPGGDAKYHIRKADYELIERILSR